MQGELLWFNLSSCNGRVFSNPFIVVSCTLGIALGRCWCSQGEVLWLTVLGCGCTGGLVRVSRHSKEKVTSQKVKNGEVNENIKYTCISWAVMVDWWKSLWWRGILHGTRTERCFLGKGYLVWGLNKQGLGPFGYGHYSLIHKILSKCHSGKYFCIALGQEAVMHVNVTGNIAGSRDTSNDQEGVFWPETCFGPRNVVLAWVLKERASATDVFVKLFKGLNRREGCCALFVLVVYL